MTLYFAKRNIKKPKKFYEGGEKAQALNKNLGNVFSAVETVGSAINSGESQIYTDIYGDTNADPIARFVGDVAGNNNANNYVDSYRTKALNSFNFNGSTSQDLMNQYSNANVMSLDPIEKRKAGRVIADNLTASAKGASAGSAFGPYGALIGGIAGAVLNWGSQGFGRKRRIDINNAIAQANKEVQTYKNSSFGNAASNFEKNNMFNLESSYLGANGGMLNRNNNNDMDNILAFGGNVFTQGTTFPIMSHIDTGGTHEESPLGGVPAGVDQEGNPNLVEEGETIYNDYVFSNRLRIPEVKVKKGEKITREQRVLKRYQGMTYAEASKKAERLSGVSENPNDEIARRSFEAELEILAQNQEEQKEEQRRQEMIEELSRLSPEELQALEQQLAQNMAQQQAAEQQMAEQQAMQQQAAMQQQGQQVPMQEIQMSPEQEQQMQEQAMQEQLMAQAAGQRQFAEGGMLSEDELAQQQAMAEAQMQEQIAEQQMSQETTPEATEQPSNQFPSSDAEDMSTAELNAVIDQILAYARQNGNRELARSARKAKKASREDKEDFVDDALDGIRAKESEAQMAQQEQEMQAQQEQMQAQEAQMQEQQAVPMQQEMQQMQTPENQANTFDGGGLKDKWDIEAFLNALKEAERQRLYAKGNSGIPYASNLAEQAKQMQENKDYQQFYEDLIAALDTEEGKKIIKELARLTGKPADEITEAYIKDVINDSKQGYWHTMPIKINNSAEAVVPITEEESTPQVSIPAEDQEQPEEEQGDYHYPNGIRYAWRDDEGELHYADIPDSGIDGFNYDAFKKNGVNYLKAQNWSISPNAEKDNDGNNVYLISKNNNDITYPKAKSWPYIVGLGLNGLALGYNAFKKPDYTYADNLIEAYNNIGKDVITPRYVRTNLPYLPLDREHEYNKALALNRAGNSSIINLSNANPAAKRASVIANDNNLLASFADIDNKAYEANWNRLKDVTQHRSSEDQFNSNLAFNVDSFNAQRRNNSLTGLAEAYKMKQGIDDAKAAAITANLQGLADNLFNLYNNKYTNDQVEFALKTNGRGNIGTANGGKLKRRKKGLL